MPFFCTGILIAIGVLIALPVLSSSQQKSQESQTFRKALIVKTVVISFFVAFLGIQMLNAVVTSILWYPTSIKPPPCVEDDCGLEYHLLVKDGANKPIFIAELWMHYIVPPPMLSEDSCFTGNEIVCYLVNKRKYPGMPQAHLMNYMMGLGMALIPAVVSSGVVFFFTRNNRKRKNE